MKSENGGGGETLARQKAGLRGVAVVATADHGMAPWSPAWEIYTRPPLRSNPSGAHIF